MTNVKISIKRLIFSFLGLHPQPVIICAHSGSPERATQMAALMHELVPGLEHIHIHADPSLSPGEQWLDLTRRLKGRRIALAAVLFDSDPRGDALRQAMLAYAPLHVLAFNTNLERHHLSLASPIASLLFLGGVPLDRIWLRPRWLWPAGSDRSVRPTQWCRTTGRPFRPGYPRAAILSPYLAWPLSHGGAVRIWNLLREASRYYDVLFFGFEDGQTPDDIARVAALCPFVFVADKPRYREPRWSTLRPPEVCEFYSPPLRDDLRRILREHDVSVVQTEYTQMAAYGGDVLVEHDVTFDLYSQIHAHRQSLSSWWNLFRWQLFEMRAVRRFRKVVTMSAKDTALLNASNAVAVPNGVDLRRFSSVPEQPTANAAHILFIGSFRHFPNRQAWEFFVEAVWPLLEDIHHRLRVTCVAGPDPHLYWNRPAPHPNIELRGFTADVKPLYNAAHLVIVPTVVSAGTNLKALEAMATGRAMVSTPSGVAGLGLTHGESVWIGATAEEFAGGIRALLADGTLRHRIASAARQIAVRHFGWPALARIQVRIWDSLLPLDRRIEFCPLTPGDLDAIIPIQSACPDASQWTPHDYLAYDTTVATLNGVPVAFLVTRAPVPDEVEILNLAVHPNHRRMGLATRLLQPLLESEAALYLEVRESNHAAQVLYESLGFVVAGRRRDYYSNPREDALTLTRAAS